MKKVSVFLSFLCLNAGLVFAGGETGNGSPILVSENVSTGEVLSAESYDLLTAETAHGIEIKDVQTEDEAITQAINRLSAIDPQFLSYFNFELWYTRDPDRVQSYTVSSGPVLAYGGNRFSNNSVEEDGTPGDIGNAPANQFGSFLVHPMQFNDQTGKMEVFQIFDAPSLGVTSRAAIKIQATIYLVTQIFLPSPDSALASDLMVQLMAKKFNPTETSTLTHAILSADLRTFLF